MQTEILIRYKSYKPNPEAPGENVVKKYSQENECTSERINIEGVIIRLRLLIIMLIRRV